MYKFEIYRNPTAIYPKAASAETSRYYEGVYMFERNITPKWSDLSIKYEKENDREFFRKNLDGAFTLIGGDYDWAYSILLDDDESKKYRFLKISEKSDGVWSEVYKGFFNVADGIYNITNCSVEFSRLLPFDKYSSILENIEFEKNMIDALKLPIPVYYGVNEYMYESYITTTDDTYWSYGSINNGAYITYPTSLTTGLNYSLYEEKYTTSTKVFETSGGDCIYTCNVTTRREYRRDYQWAASDPGAAWDEDTDAGVDINGNKRWVRCYHGNCSPSFGLVKWEATVNIYNSKPGANPNTTTCAVPTVYDGIYTSTVIEDDIRENNRGRQLRIVIDHAISDYINYNNPNNPQDTRYKSEFFNDPTNPITGETNRLQYTIVWQLSDIRDTSDEATLAMYSIRTIEEWLSIWEVFWYIDDDGRFVYEHKKFFDKGLSYGENSIGLDISNENVRTEIEYADDLYRTEQIEFMYSINPDFVGIPIRYYDNVVNRRENESHRTQSYQVATDLNQVVSNPDDIGTDGFFIATASINDVGTELTVHKGDGILSDTTISNVYMATSYIQDYYWKYGRSSDKGFMNRSIQEFTKKRTLIHSDIVVGYCGDFDPMKLVRTSYGDGKVEEAVLTLKDKRLTLTLSY